jgi:hypothetical protein
MLPAGFAPGGKEKPGVVSFTSHLTENAELIPSRNGLGSNLIVTFLQVARAAKFLSFLSNRFGSPAFFISLCPLSG